MIDGLCVTSVTPCDPSCLTCSDTTPEACTSCDAAGSTPLLAYGYGCFDVCPDG